MAPCPERPLNTAPNGMGRRAPKGLSPSRRKQRGDVVADRAEIARHEFHGEEGERQGGRPGGQPGRQAGPEFRQECREQEGPGKRPRYCAK